MQSVQENAQASADAHTRFLEISTQMTRLRGGHGIAGPTPGSSNGAKTIDRGSQSDRHRKTPIATVTRLYSRRDCLAFATGSVASVFGPEFAVVDTYKARVRLPDEPLMLVDRVVSLVGEKCLWAVVGSLPSMMCFPDAWYLDGNRAPACISVEAGQADLFLSSYLGIDHVVKGQRTYRLLDACVTFFRGLPRPGETIRYEIEIEKFIRQGETHLFFFKFKGYIEDKLLIQMKDGCAGFFTEAEVRNSGGIVKRKAMPTARKRWRHTHMAAPCPGMHRSVQRQCIGCSEIRTLR